MKVSSLIRNHYCYYYYWIATRVTTISTSALHYRNLHHRLNFCSSLSLLLRQRLLRHNKIHPSIISNKRTFISVASTTTSTIINDDDNDNDSNNDNIIMSGVVPTTAPSQFQCYHIQHAPNELIPEWMKVERTRILTKCRKISNKDNSNNNCIVYWMQRDVRAVDNWALLWSCYLANKYNVPLRVMYVIQPPSTFNNSNNNNDVNVPNLQNLPMTIRHGQFILGGLESVYEQLSKYNIPLHIIMSPSHEKVGETVCQYINKWNPLSIICDMSPIRHYREWIEIQTVSIFNKQYTNIPMYQVDAHNVIPVWIASTKREYAARTLRPKINKLIDLYLKPYPDNMNTILSSCNKDHNNMILPQFDRILYENYMQMDNSVGILSWAKPGNDAGMKQFDTFINNGLSKFSILRNEPNQCPNICSQLSPWINHGHISFQTLGCIVKKLNKYATSSASYLEEGIIRRELSDNFVFYEPNKYDTIYSAYEWAIETLQTHSNDIRENTYNIHDLEIGNTHDDLWNAAQIQAITYGKMHGYLRMYWAKKILEWTISPEQALLYGHYLNDKYNIDGRDPNGFVGVNWCIIGIHDQGWAERSVFGKIRYMNYAGCKRKFNITEFVAKYPPAAENAAKVKMSKNMTLDTPTKKKQQTKMTAFTSTTPTKAAAKPAVVKGTKSLKQQTKMTEFTTTPPPKAAKSAVAKGSKSLEESTLKRKTTMIPKSSSTATARITKTMTNKKSKK